MKSIDNFLSEKFENPNYQVVRYDSKYKNQFRKLMKELIKSQNEMLKDLTPDEDPDLDDALGENDVTFLALNSNNDAIAFSTISLKSGFENTVSLTWIYVSPDERGMGISKILIKHSIDFAKNNGFKKMVTGVIFNNPARKLYEKMGFNPYHIAMYLNI